MKRFAFLSLLMLLLFFSACSAEEQNLTDHIDVKQKTATITSDLQGTDTEQVPVTSDADREDYDAATETKTLPVYSTYLRQESTVTLYYRDGELFSVRPEYKRSGESIRALRGFSEDACFERIETYARDYPEDQIEGVIYTGGESVGEVYLLVRNAKDGYLYHYCTSRLPFRLVDPFRTAEEGQSAFAAYFAAKEAYRSRLVIFPWKETTVAPLINLFQSVDLPTLRRNANNEELYWYIGSYYEETPRYYDNYIEIPLLDEQGNEGSCALYLIFHHNDLLAELVLERQTDSKNGAAKVLWENAATCNPDGSYCPLETSRYEAALRDVDLSGISGVCFADGDYTIVR